MPGSAVKAEVITMSNKTKSSFEKLTLEDFEFIASLGYIVSETLSAKPKGQRYTSVTKDLPDMSKAPYSISQTTK